MTEQVGRMSQKQEKEMREKTKGLENLDLNFYFEENWKILKEYVLNLLLINEL